MRTKCLLALAVVAPVLVGCENFQRVEDAVVKGCAEVLPLARIAAYFPGIPASISAYAIAACDTAAGLAKLRADPTSVEWLMKIRADFEKLFPKK